MSVVNTRRPALRGTMIFFGVGLAILWIISLAAGTHGWFAWLDLLGAGLGIYAAVVMPEIDSSLAQASGYVFSVGVIIMWIIGLAERKPAWLVWLSLLCAVVLLIGTVVRSGRVLQPAHEAR